MLKNILRIQGAMQLSKYEQHMLKGGWADDGGCYQQGDLCCVPTAFGREVCRVAKCNQGIACIG